MTETLLGKKVRNVGTGEVGQVVGIHALDIDGSEAVYCEVPVIKADGSKHPHMFKIWRIDAVEVVE